MLTFWELPPSPNSVKVRMALRFKGIEFELKLVNPADRGEIRELTGQDLTPFIEDKGIVLTDSEAIIHYLDANYRDTPRLWPAAREGRRACEAWDRTLQEEVARHWAPVFFYAMRFRDELDEEARAQFRDGLEALDTEIGDASSFKQGEEDMAICDLRVAEWACYALPSPGLIERAPVFASTSDAFGVEAGSLPNLERFLQPWLERLA